MTTARIKKFRKLVFAHYHKNGRHDMPWRKTKDPYKILISEVMLQQTQVSRVLLKYPQFLRAFPTLESLAKASQKRILSVWQGMGYNRRAIALKRLAKRVMAEYGGRIPRSKEALEDLPGIGPYTACAILVFAFNKPEVCIETNIRRAYIHHFFPNGRKVSDKKLLPVIEVTMDKKNPCEWYWALMDYGAVLGKKIKNPNRKSKHYARQPAFKGSNREVRGLIIKTLLREGSLRVKDLKQQIQCPNLTKNLDTLTRERFLQKKGNAYALL